MCFPKELLVSGDMLKQISEEDAERDLELQSVIPSSIKPMSEMKSTSPFGMSSSQPKNLPVSGQPEVDRKVVVKLADRQKFSQSHPTASSEHKSLKDPIPIHRRTNSISLKPKGHKTFEAKGPDLRKKKSRELGEGKCQCRRKPNRVLKEYKEAAKLKNVKVQNVIAKDYIEILGKFPAHYKLLNKAH